MIVKNRKTGKEYPITKADWAKLTEQKLSRNFIVMDENDNPKQKIQIPKVIEEYQQTKVDELRIVKESKQEKTQSK
jgi:hypothetical protein